MSEQARFTRLAGRALTLPNVALWVAAAAVMLSVHAAGIWVARDWQPIGPPPAGNPPPAIEFDLAPPSILPEASPQEAVEEVLPDQTENTPTETVQPVEPEPVQPQVQEVEPTPVEPQAVPEQTPPEPEPVPAETVEPDLPAKDKAEVILPAAPKPKPKKEKKPAPRKEPERPRPVVQPKPAVVAPRQQAVQATAPRQQGSATGDELAAWKRAVQVKIGRIANAMPASKKGSVGVSFSVSAGGQASRGRVSKSSGDPDLDARALSVIGRLGTIGAPPGGGAAPINITIFFR